MSKRMSIFVVIALIAVLGFHVADFISAPLSVGTYIKTQIGFRQIRAELEEAYAVGGLDAVEQKCHWPFSKNGIYFTASIGLISTFGSDGRFEGEQVMIAAHYTPFEAQLSEVGATFYNTRDLHEFARSAYDPPVQELKAFADPMSMYDFKLRWVKTS